jgi:SAM-dependent methyltransferase
VTDPAETLRRHGLVGPPELWQLKRNFQISFLRRFGLQPENFLLDLGCGTLRGGIPLIEFLDVGHYFGVDSRAEVMPEAQQELLDSHLQAKYPALIHSPDISQLAIDRKFDYIWAFSVLIHMTDKILVDALSFVRLHLAPGGVFYANVVAGETNSENVWREFPLVQRPFEFYAENCAQNGLSIVDMGPLEQLGHGPEMTNGMPLDRRMYKMILS